MSRETKTDKVRQHLLKGKEITPKEAYFKYGTMRLGAIIFNLRKEGLNIENLNPKSEYGKYKIQD